MKRSGRRYLCFLAIVTLSSFLVLLLIWPLSGQTPQDETGPGPGPVPPPPELEAPAAVLMDLDTGKLLFTKGAHDRRAPGGLTKILTALLVFERGGLDEGVRISQDAAGAPGMSLNLQEGERAPLKDLLSLMFYRPGIDAALAVAEHVAGSTEAFAAQMNVAAARLGVGASHFKNPHGFDEPGHVSTPYDLAVISASALQNPDFAEMAKARRAVIPWRGRRWEALNLNSFLWRYRGAIGVMTAYTPESGHSLVGAAENGGHRLLVVLLGCPTGESRRHDATDLLDYGFAHHATLVASPQVDRSAYEVQPGDTLSGLARRFSVPISAIRLLNDLEDPDRLKTGDKLWIPE